jgi:hypothetical protein
MSKTIEIQLQSATSILSETSLESVRRLVACIEAISYALLRRRILSALTVCSIVWLASLWLAAALAQAQESPSNESGISVSQPAPAQSSIATTEASHLVVSMVDRRELRPGAPPNSATQFTNPHSTNPHSAGKVLLPPDSQGTEYASLAALAAAPSSSPLRAIQAKGSAQIDTGSSASDKNVLVYQFGTVNFVLNGLPNSFSMSSPGSSLAGAR